MIIDLILDRKMSSEDDYDPNMFYLGIMEYTDIFPDLSNPISRAMDEGEEEDVKRELCNYIEKCGYNTEIKDYINSVSWL